MIARVRQLAPAVDGARAAIESAGERHGPAADEDARFELFHAAGSICSQKVRAVLIHHRIPWISHELNMFLGQTYLPGYVRLRMLGCARYGGALVSRHSGSTSAGAGGCDGAVVPTLVDWEAEEVVVDSRRICIYLDEQIAERERLRPADRAVAIDGDLEVIDNLPNYQMLMGRTVSGTESATTRSGVGASFSERKVAWCSRYLEENGDDPVLAAAYTAKRAKELSAANELFTPEAMAAAYGRAEAALVELDRKLGARGTHWLHGDRLSMADLFWGIELLRMRNTGVARFWEKGRLPKVERFSAETEKIPAIRAAIIDWPGAIF